MRPFGVGVAYAGIDGVRMLPGGDGGGQAMVGLVPEYACEKFPTGPLSGPLTGPGPSEPCVIYRVKNLFRWLGLPG